jgi:hypothetical protein
VGYAIFFDRDQALTLDEWKQAVSNRHDVRPQERSPTAKNPVTGETLTLGATGGDAEVLVDSRWLPLFRRRSSGHVVFDAPPGFEDPANAVRRLTVELASQLGARLVGEEGESYG